MARVASGNQRNGPVGTCKLCERSIFHHQERVFITKPVLGMVHKSCRDRPCS